MTPRPRFTLVFARVTLEHFGQIEQKQHSAILNEIKEQLSHVPNVPTQNRKLLRQPAPYGARWELRVGENNRFRVFYEIDELAREVRILAVGVKVGSKLRIGKEEVSS